MRNAAAPFAKPLPVLLACALLLLPAWPARGAAKQAEPPGPSALLAQERYAEALAAVEAQLRADPEDKELRLTRARCLFMLGRYRDALGAAEALLNVAPERQDVLDFRADCLFAGFRPAEAAKAWEPLLGDRRWKGTAIKKSATALVATGEDARAGELVTAAIEPVRSAPDDLLFLALRVLDTGGVRRSALEELLARNPDGGGLRGEMDLVRALGDRAPAEVVPPPSLPIRIKLREVRGEPSLQVLLEGKRSTYLAFDTGSQRMVLNRDVSRRLKLEPVATTLREGWGGQDPEEAKTVLLGSVRLGTLDVRSVPAQVSTRDAEFWTDKAGYIGLAPFRSFVTLYDRRGGRVEIHPRGTSPRVLLGDPEAVALPILWSSGLPLVPVTVNGLPGLPFLLDTGAPTTLLDTSLGRRLGLRASPKYRRGYGLGVSGAFTYAVAEGVTLEFAGVRSPAPFAGLTDVPQRFCVPCYGILGRDFLNRFRMVFDSPGCTVTLVPYP